jgi:hypothetical protein
VRKEFTGSEIQYLNTMYPTNWLKKWTDFLKSFDKTQVLKLEDRTN